MVQLRKKFFAGKSGIIVIYKRKLIKNKGALTK